MMDRHSRQILFPGVSEEGQGTYPSGTIHLSPGYLNTVEEIDLTLHAVEKITRAKLPQGLPRTTIRFPAKLSET